MTHSTSAGRAAARLLLGASLAATLAVMALPAHAAPVEAATTDTCGYPVGSTGRPATVFNENGLATWIQLNGAESTATISVYADDENGILLGVTDSSSPATVTPFTTAGSTQLTVPIAHNTNYTTLSVAPLPLAYAQNDHLTVSSGGQHADVTLTAPAPAAATTLQVHSFNPNQVYPAGSSVDDQQVDHAHPYGHASNPSVGDENRLDPSGRPEYPAIFITNITSDGQASTAGDWQHGGAPQTALADVFGTWVAGSYNSSNVYQKPAQPAVHNHVGSGYAYGPGSDAPGGTFANANKDAYGAELRWNVSSLKDDHGAPLQPNASYRVQVILHDGDQNKNGGDAAEVCTYVAVPAAEVPDVPVGLAGMGIVVVLAGVVAVVLRRPRLSPRQG